MSTGAERVALGAVFLDEHDPDWWKPGVRLAIDLDELDQRWADTCVLGQRCPDAGGYFEQVAKLGIDDEAEDQAVSLGFLTNDGTADALTVEWRRVIEARRAGVTP